MQNIENEKIEVYEINEKKYTVRIKCIENSKNLDKIYEVLCKFAISNLS